MTSSAHGKSTDTLLKTAHDWRQRLNRPDVSENDRAAFEDWIEADPRHEQIYGQAVTFWEAFGEVEKSTLDPRVFEPTLNERFDGLFWPVRAVVGRPVFSLSALGAAIACIAALIIVPSVQNSAVPSAVEALQTIAYSSPKSEMRRITLDDGTFATLGAQTAIEVVFSKEERLVQLSEGSAYFEVSSDLSRPFSVRAGDLTATALGTSYSVSQNAGVFRVAVTEGDVEVSYPIVVDEEASSLRSRKRLGAGEQVAASLTEGLQSIENIDIEAIAAWRDGLLIYDGAPLSEVVADLNRYSQIPIRIADNDEAIESLRLRGGYKIEDIDSLLQATEFVHPVSIDQTDPSEIVIRPKAK